MLQWYWCMYVFLCLLFLLRTTPHNSHKHQPYKNFDIYIKIVLLRFLYKLLQAKNSVVFKMIYVCFLATLVFGGIVSNCIPKTVIQVHATAILRPPKWYFPWNISLAFGTSQLSKKKQFAPKIWRLPFAKSAGNAFAGKWPSIESAIGQEWAIVADFNLNQI